MARRTRPGRRVTRTASARTACRPHRCGIDCIEHACGLDRRHASPLCATRGVAVVPTLVNLETFPGIAATAERSSRSTPRTCARSTPGARQRRATRTRPASRCTPAPTRAGRIAHGLVADEVLELAAAGVPRRRRCRPRRGGARSWLGRDGLSEGAQADLVVYPDDPRQDLRVLTAPSHVVLRGRVWA
jgi:hypothetical protein